MNKFDASGRDFFVPRDLCPATGVYPRFWAIPPEPTLLVAMTGIAAVSIFGLRFAKNWFTLRPRHNEFRHHY